MAKKQQGDKLPPGYLAISRKFFEHSFWKEARVYSWAEAWIDLLQSAWFGEKPSRQIINKSVIYYGRGEMVASIRFLAQRWRWPHGNVQRFVDLLERENMITRRTEKNQTIVTIINYKTYNGIGSKSTGYATPENPGKSGTPVGTPNSTSVGTPNANDNKELIVDSGTPVGTPNGTPSDTLAVHPRYKEEEGLEESKERIQDSAASIERRPPSTK